jgi:hypothetical protein
MRKKFSRVRRLDGWGDEEMFGDGALLEIFVI